jgi:hypothetical protein
MNYDISNCVFPFLGYSEFLRNQKFPLIIEGKNGNGVPNPRFRGSWCLVAEEFAAMLLNSGVIEIPWKKDFEIIGLLSSSEYLFGLYIILLTDSS